MRPSFLSYEHRPEYDVRKNASLRAQALESFEEIIDQADDRGLVAYTVRDGVVRRQLDMYQTDEGLRSEEEVLLSDFTLLRLERSPVQTEAQLIVEDYRSGPLRRMARLTLRDFIADSPTPFINEYNIETFAGGVEHALVSTTDIIRGEGLDARPMVPYDFAQLSRLTRDMVDRVTHLVNGVSRGNNE